MKRKDIMEKYNLSRGAWYTLLSLGKIEKSSTNNYIITDETFVASFNYEKYKQQKRETPEYKAMLSTRNTKINQNRWSNISEEDRQVFKEKVSEGVNKHNKEHPESIEKMRQGLKKYFSIQENRDKVSAKQKAYFANKDNRIKMSLAVKLHWTPAMREQHSLKMKAYWQEHPEKIEQMKETNRQSQKLVWTEEKRKEQSLKLSAIWAKEGHNILEKAAQTMKENGTSNSSKPAYESIELLKDAGFTVVPEKPYPEKRWKCDAYIEELDCWIEFHYGLYHNWMPYDKSNPEHIKQAQYLYENFFGQKRKKGHHIYYTWTNLDVRKREYAKETGMTWFEFYTKGDFEQWLKTLLN